MKLIGISGKARHGKDSLAGYLNKKLKKSIILHFADELYKECSTYRFRAVGGDEDKRVAVFSPRTLFFMESNSPVYEHILNIGKEQAPGNFIYTMKEKDTTLLQWWGTNIRRKEFDENYWTNALGETIKRLAEKEKMYNYVIVPDIRFLNEVEFVKRYDGVVVRVIRTINGEPFVAKDRDPEHPSEVDLDKFEGWDFVISAEDLKGLYDEAKDFIQKLKIDKAPEE